VTKPTKTTKTTKTTKETKRTKWIKESIKRNKVKALFKLEEGDRLEQFEFREEMGLIHPSSLEQYRERIVLIDKLNEEIHGCSSAEQDICAIAITPLWKCYFESMHSPRMSFVEFLGVLKKYDVLGDCGCLDESNPSAVEVERPTLH
jgi:hypothetical protein